MIDGLDRAVTMTAAGRCGNAAAGRPDLGLAVAQRGASSASGISGGPSGYARRRSAGR